MPQIKAEKKFLQTRVRKTHDNFAPFILQNLLKAAFPGFRKNNTGGVA